MRFLGEANSLKGSRVEFTKNWGWENGDAELLFGRKKWFWKPIVVMLAQHYECT